MAMELLKCFTGIRKFLHIHSETKSRNVSGAMALKANDTDTTKRSRVRCLARRSDRFVRWCLGVRVDLFLLAVHAFLSY